MVNCFRKSFGGAVFLALAAASAQALPARAFERAELFANCSGRLSALATHQSGYGEGTFQQTRDMAEMFDMMLEAVLPHALDEGMPQNQITLWRSQGWGEMAGLLTQAHFSFDTISADAAMAALDERVLACTSVMLPNEPTELGHLMRSTSPTR